MKTPEVSVVLAVRDDPWGLEVSAASVLAQRDVDLELVLVDDGSASPTAAAAERIAAGDSRVHLARLERTGLTGALIAGCAAARAPLIARHDAGDASHPERLRRQLGLLREHAEVSFVSCWTLCLGPEGEELQTVESGPPDGEPIRLAPDADSDAQSCGPSSHGSVVFRRSDYEAVGGYRRPFALAQDWDLWWRLAERGAFATVPQILYSRTLSPRSLTFRHGREQRRLGQLACAAARARLRGESEDAILGAAAKTSRTLPGRWGARRGEAAGLYFIGSLLRGRGDQRASEYFWRALRKNPTMVRAWARWAESWL